MRPTIVAACALLFTAGDAFALNPALDISQYGHTSWRVGDGVLSSSVNAITQTPDGYLWLGTDKGLLRFDGVRIVAWQAPTDQALPSLEIRSLLAGRTGTLWIGTSRGLASWKDRRLTQYDDLRGNYVAKIVEGHDGTLWVAAARITPYIWRLCSIQHGRTECYGEDGGPGAGTVGLYEDRKGTLWTGTADGVWQWQHGPRRFFPLTRLPNGFQGLAETHDGELLVSMNDGVRRLRDGRAEMLYPFPTSMHGNADVLLRDRDGVIWVGRRAFGLVHVHQGITDLFAEADGLSGDGVSAIFEDREGNIWVATSNGLDRFRDTPVALFSARQGLSNSNVQSVLASRDGDIWVGTADGLSRLNGSRVTVYRDHRRETREGSRAPASRAVRAITGRGLPGSVNSLYEDRRGRVWAATPRGVGLIEGDRFGSVNGLPGGLTRAIVEDSRNLWVANEDLGLYEVADDGQIVQHRSWAALSEHGSPTAVAADSSKPGLWLGFAAGAVINVVDGKVRASYGGGDGLAGGVVRWLRLDRAGALWVSGDGGLSRVKSGRVATLTRRDGLPCDEVAWSAEDAQSLWLGMSCGVVRIARSQLEAWSAGVNNGSDVRPEIHATMFDSGDGADLFVSATHYSAPAAIAADGGLWFITKKGLSVLDPRRLPFNSVPPPVHIEQITADRKEYDTTVGRVKLPALTRDLQIDYTALSLVAPEKMRFRYKLEGLDADWRDAGTRRQAFYNDLEPRTYRFRVIASNNSGVWNESGAVLDFSVAPAYYQTNWFSAVSVASIVALVWGAHRFRLRIVETHQREISALNQRLMKAQEQERIRIAGELHDGVMQQMLAVTMMVGSAKRRVTANPADAARTMDKVQEKLVQVGSDIRQLSHDLHPPILQEAGLPAAVQSYCDEFSAAHGVRVSCDADERVRDLSRGAALALFRILQEALGNAAKHAAARQITVRLARSNGVVSLTVADDGVGFDRNGLATSGLGLITMRERAGQLGGTFDLESAPERGTTIRVAIPFR